MAKTKAGYGTGRDVAALAENMELLTGQRGNKLDKAITYRELADIGLITLRKAANNSFTGIVAPGVLPDESVQRPVAPSGVIANGAFHTILVEWDMPAYKGHAYAEVWRADSDNRALAVMVGTSAANLYSDAIGKGATVYYWVRFVNRNDISGPFNAMAGVMAQTSRDVQDILDELEGKIKDSHLADELLGPIREVPNIKADLSDLDTALAKTDAALKALDAREQQVNDLLKSAQEQLGSGYISVTAIQETLRQKIEQYRTSSDDFRDTALAKTDAALKALDAREQQVNDLLKSAQEQLGSGYISVTAIQETLRQKIEQYRTSFDDFRDAVFAVDPTTGEITMDAVNAVSNELGMEISIVSQHLNAVEAIVNTCVTRAEIQGDLERIVNVEQELDGINATLKQTATKSEVNDVSSKVSQVSQELDATNSKLTQKAAQSEVDSHGQRLSAAEQQISANTEADKATASRIEQVKAQLDAAYKTISAGITELANAVATDKEATAQRLSNIEASVNGQSAAISDLQKVVSGDEQSIAGRFENIQASIDLSAKAAIGNTLASAEADRQNRNASGQIRRDQEVIVTEQKAQAQVIEDMRTSFEAELSETDARITSVQTTLSDADRAMAERVDAVESAYKEADQQTAASISSLQQTMTSTDSALAQSISRIESEYKAADSATSGAISALQKVVVTEQKAQAQVIEDMRTSFEAELSETDARITSVQTTLSDADRAMAERVDAVESAYKEADQQTAASISSLQQTMTSTDSALAQSISRIESEYKAADSATSGAISALQKVVSGDRQSIAGRFENIQASIDLSAKAAIGNTLASAEADRQNRNASGQIRRDQEVIVTEQKAQAQVIEDMRTSFEAELSETDARITSVQTTLSDADRAMAERVDAVESAYKEADQQTTASISSLQQTMTSTDSALAQSISRIESEYKAADSATSGAISALQKVVSDGDSALSQQITTVQASAASANSAASTAQSAADQAKADAATAAGIANGKGKVLIQSTTPAVADRLAQNLWIDTTGGANTPKRWNGTAWAAVTDKAATDAASAAAAAQATADAAATQATQNSAAIQSEATARANADGALSSRIDQVTSSYQGADSLLQGQITSESTARANADSALAQQITTVQASAASANSAASTAQSAADQAKADAATAAGIANGKGKVLIQSTSPAVADRLAQNLWIDTTGGANTPKRWNGTAWAAVTDKAATDAASAAAAAQATADAAKSQAETLSAAVQVQSQAISDLQNGAQAMWTAKANAGGITAGIGLIAKSDGTSQVAISASQVFVFNPNSPAATSPLFAIDNGQVVMAEAIIRTATIQILNSQQITADYVKAGISLSAPVINGGQITIGTNFSVNAAGAMSAWSATLRYVTSIYGTFSQATIDTCTINNCIINENCDVKGTVYAGKIVGDVYTKRAWSISKSSATQSPGWYQDISLGNIYKATFNRNIWIAQIYGDIGFSTGPNGVVYGRFWWQIIVNGTVLEEAYTDDISITNTSTSVQSYRFTMPTLTNAVIPANVGGATVLRIGWARTVSGAGSTPSVMLNMKVQAEVFRVDSTFS